MKEILQDDCTAYFLEKLNYLDTLTLSGNLQDAYTLESIKKCLDYAI